MNVRVVKRNLNMKLLSSWDFDIHPVQESKPDHFYINRSEGVDYIYEEQFKHNGVLCQTKIRLEHKPDHIIVHRDISWDDEPQQWICIPNGEGGHWEFLLAPGEIRVDNVPGYWPPREKLDASEFYDVSGMAITVPMDEMQLGPVLVRRDNGSFALVMVGHVRKGIVHTPSTQLLRL